MTTASTAPTDARAAKEPGGFRRDSWWTGRGELSVALLALVAAALLIVGTVTMNVRGDQEPGPQFFPIIVICLLLVTGGWVTVQALLPRRSNARVWHRPDISEDMLADVSGTNTELIKLDHLHAAAGAEDETTFDWRTFGLVLGAVVLFAVLLNPVGWICSAAILFWLVSYALGSRRPVFDIGVAFILSSAVQLAFSAGLGLALPAGFFGWIF